MHKTHIQKLADYIKKNLRKGYTLDSLRFSLINQGYSKISVENAIELMNRQLAMEIPFVKERPEIVYKIIEEDPEPEDDKANISNSNEENSETNININTNTNKGFWKSLFE